MSNTETISGDNNRIMNCGCRIWIASGKFLETCKIHSSTNFHSHCGCSLVTFPEGQSVKYCKLHAAGPAAHALLKALANGAASDQAPNTQLVLIRTAAARWIAKVDGHAK